MQKQNIEKIRDTKIIYIFVVIFTDYILKKIFLYILILLYFVPLKSQIVVSPAFHAVQYRPVETQNGNPCPGMPTFTDERDGNVYPTVQIGNQCWLAENLAYLPSVVGQGTVSNNTSYYYVYGYDGTSVSDAKATANYTAYGVLYNWTAAMTACPPGWHLPSDDEWTELINYVVSQGYPNESDNLNGAGNALKSCRQVNSPLGGNCDTSEHPRWDSHSTHYGTDVFGFTAVPGGGFSYYGYFVLIGNYGSWWSATEFDPNYTWYRNMHYNVSNVHRDYVSKRVGFSVRCLWDCPEPETPTGATHTSSETQIIWNWNSVADADGYKYNTENNYETATDNGTSTSFTQEDLICETEYTLYVWAYNECGNSEVLELNEGTENPNSLFECGDTYIDCRDGNVYPTVQIGNQCWMAKNLAYLPSVVGPEIGSSTTIYYYVYGYTGTVVADAKATSNYNTYGVLYNWPAAMAGASGSISNPSGVQGVCPAGWHLPSDDEWKELEMYLGMTEQESNTTGWRHSGNVGEKLKTDTWGGDNSSGFYALPGGRLSNNGSFYSLNIYGYLWSSSESGSSAWLRYLGSSFSGVGRDARDKDLGYSVRCLKDL